MIHNQSFSIDFKRNRFIYLYYLLLHIICLSWTNTAMVHPPMVLRLAITAGVFLPLIKYFWMAPAVIILFVGLRFNSVAPFGYIPQSWDIYEYIILLIAVLHAVIYKNKKIFRFNNTQVGLFAFLFLIDLVNLQPFSNMFFFSLMLFVLYNSIQDRESLNLAIFSFIILTITLSIYYFVFAKEFMVSYYGSHEERSTWVDPNYFGILLGCGVILSSAFFYKSINFQLNKVYKALFGGCIVLGIMVIALQASRGSVLAVGLAMMIQLLLSKNKLYIKLIFLFITIVGIIYLFQSDYFNLLIDRVKNDDGSGSGRAEVWVSKINDWASSLFNILGGGFQSSIYKFTPLRYDCHNEYVSILLNYGVVGIIALFILIYRLCRIARNRTFIWSVVAYISIAFMTLSPFSCETGWNACPFLILLLYKFIALDKVGLNLSNKYKIC